MFLPYIVFLLCFNFLFLFWVDGLVWTANRTDPIRIRQNCYIGIHIRPYLPRFGSLAVQFGRFEQIGPSAGQP